MKNYEFSYDISKKLAQRKNVSKLKRLIVPNKLEVKLGKMLGSKFQYAGDGSFKIDNLKPDFVDKTRKIVVEAYGDYFHKNDTIQKTMIRIQRFEKQGYKTIIIWESDINKISK